MTPRTRNTLIATMETKTTITKQLGAILLAALTTIFVIGLLGAVISFYAGLIQWLFQ